MTIQELLNYHKARVEENKLPGANWSNEKWILKAMEELGELAQAFCKDKPIENKKEEICDVIHTLFVLANKNGVTVQDIINKFNEVSNRKGSSIFILPDDFQNITVSKLYGLPENNQL